MRITDRTGGLERLLARKSVGRVLRLFMRPLPAASGQMEVREGYRLWAPTYADETLPCFLDEELARDMLGGLPKNHLLDAGCGVGRRIRDIPGATGIDLSPEMLATSGLKNVVAGDIRQQTERTLENVKAIVEAAGSKLGHVIKTTVFLKNMGDFAAMNEIYARYFSAAQPARSTVEVARLPKDALVEVEVIATT